MKNKILASVLAVCLFVGMAVPAFADYTSAVDGDSAKIKTIEFVDGDKVIPEIKIKKGGNDDIANYVRLFESKDQLVLNKGDLEYSLDGGALVFGITGSKVSAIEDKGSANVVVKNTLTGKEIGKIKVVAVPADPAKKEAYGYKFKNNANVQVVGTGAVDDVKITVIPTPANSYFTGSQQAAIQTAVEEELENILSHDDFVGTIDAGNLIGVAANHLVIRGLPQYKDLTIETIAKTGATPALADNDFRISDPSKSGDRATIKIMADAKDRDLLIPVSALNAKIKKAYPTAYATYEVAGKATANFTLASGQTDLAVKTYATGDTAVGATTWITPTFTVAPSDSSNTDLVFTMPKAEALKLRDFTHKQTVKITDPAFPDGTGKLRTVTTSASFKNDPAIDTKAIGGPGSITIEVGEERDLSKDIGYGPSDANINKACTYSPEYVDGAEYSDFAAINDLGNGKIMGIRKGVNKVVVTSKNDPTQTTTVIVNVVSRGSKKPEVKPTLGWKTSSVEVGKPLVLAVKDAKEMTFKSSDDKIAKVDAKGTITGVKAGTAKITVVADGTTLEATVTVKAASKPDGKPSTNPSTGVALLGQLF